MNSTKAAGDHVDASSGRRRVLLTNLGHGLIAGLLIALLHVSGLTLALDKRNYDLWFQLSPSSDRPAEHVVIVAVDDASLDELGSWPWPSGRLATLLRKVEQAEPAAIGLDVLLDRARDETDPELGRALLEMTNVVAAGNLRWTSGLPAGMDRPVAAFCVGTERVGFSNAVEDRTDGYIRSWRLAAQGESATPLLSLPVMLALAACGRPANDVRVDGDSVWLPQAVTARRKWPLVTLVDFLRPDRIPTLSAADVIQDRVPPEALSGKVALVGGTATAVFTDLCRTPFSDDLATGRSAPSHGVQVTANAVETLLSGVRVRELSPMLVALILLVFSVLVCSALRPLHPVWGVGAALVIVAVSAAGSLAMFTSYRLQAPVTPFALGVTGAYLVTALEKHAVADARRRLAEHRNVLLHDLSAMVTHDLKGPLTSIMGFLELLSRERLNDQQREFVQIAMGSSKWLSVLVAGILDVAKIEAGQISLNRELLDIGRELEQALAAVSYQLQEKNLQMEVAVEADLPSVPADSELFRRIVVNLVGNAAKFAPEGSTIQLGGRLDREREAVVVSVQDQGPGIAPEYQQQIFDKFVQVAKGRSAEKISVGLGLAFCRLAVEAHGGSIWVESEPGHGARFSFWLPLRPTESARAGKHRRPGPGAHAEEVDHEQTR